MPRLEAVVPVDELTNNQFASEPVLLPTEKLIGVPSVLVTATFWDDELVAPEGTVKVRALGLTTKSAVLLTTRVTGIVWTGPALPFGVTVIVPE